MVSCIAQGSVSISPWPWKLILEDRSEKFLWHYLDAWFVSHQSLMKVVKLVYELVGWLLLFIYFLLARGGWAGVVFVLSIDWEWSLRGCHVSEKLATDEVVEKRSKQLLKLLDALRSAKGERSTKIVDGEWKVKSLSPFVNISSASEGLFSIRDSLEVATYDTGGYVKDNQLHVEFINNTVRSLLYYRLRSSQPITPFSQEHT